MICVLLRVFMADIYIYILYMYFCVIAILGVVVCDMKNAITIVASVREISSKTAKMKT